nr:Rhodanese-related sulfurtransferase [Raoultella sp. NCTC 9187]
MSVVTEFTPAAPAEAAAWFGKKLSLETDCADVHRAMSEGEADCVLLHVVGSAETFARRHLPGALHIPHRHIDAARMSEWADGDAVRGLLRRSALQRRGRRGAAAGAAGKTGED